VHELATADRAGAVIGRAALPPWLAAPAAAPEPAGAERSVASPGGASTGGAGPSQGPELGAPPTREEFTRAFEELAGSVHGLAKRFGRDRRQIYRWLEAYGLREGRGRG
jgi:hypothetical protein